MSPPPRTESAGSLNLLRGWRAPHTRSGKRCGSPFFGGNRLFRPAQKVPGPWNLPAWGPRPPDPQNCCVWPEPRPRTGPVGAGSLETAKNVCSRENWRPRPLGLAQEAPGPWILPGWGPRPHVGVPLRPPKLPKTCVLAIFRENWRGRPLGPA